MRAKKWGGERDRRMLRRGREKELITSYCTIKSMQLKFHNSKLGLLMHYIILDLHYVLETNTLQVELTKEVI